MILGISLVVNELNKGQRMVYRYPESIPQSVGSGANKGLIKLYEQYFSFSLENLAKLFRPKNALYNKILEISIDDLNFVSYPCQCQGSASDDASVNDSNTTNIAAAGSLQNNPLSPVALGTSQSAEVITMFNIIVTSVSHKAMLKINPDFVYKCKYKFVSTPGSDPVAAAIGVNMQSYGLCKQSIRRIVEVVARSLLQEERGNRYVTEQVALMLRIMDNWYLSKQLDASAGGVVHMESGNSAAMAANAAATAESLSTPVASRTNPARAEPGAATGTVTPTLAVGVASSGLLSLNSTPRSSRSSSNAPLPESIPTSVAGPASASSNSSTLLSTALASAGIGAGVASSGTGTTTPRSSRSNSNAPAVNSDALASRTRTSATNSTAVSISNTPELSEAEFHRSVAQLHAGFGVARTLSINTDCLDAHSLETSPLASGNASATTPAAVPTVGISSNSTSSNTTVCATTNGLYSAAAGVASAAQHHPGNSSSSSSTATSPMKPPANRIDRSATNSPMTVPTTNGNHVDQMPPVPGVPQQNISRSGSGVTHPTTRAVASTPGKPPAVTPGAPLSLSGAGAGGVGSGSFTSGGAGLAHSMSGGVGSLPDGLSSPTSKDRRSTEWGAHLLTDFMAQSDLANELRILYHGISGGHSVNISFNGVRAIQVSLCCKDRLQCEDCLTVKAQRPLAGVHNPSFVSHLHRPLSNQASLSPMNSHNNSQGGGNNSVSINMSASGGSARARATQSFRTVGNLNSALNGFRGGKNAKDYAKIKGINLNTQTMLKIADTDTIMNILYSLDNTAFNLLNSVSESSNLDLFAESGADAQVNAQHHLRVLTSNRLCTVIEAADPTQSFLDLSLALDEPVEELISMANYLKSWGLVEIIPVIYGRSCYKVHSKSPLSRDSRVGRAFEALLLSFELPMTQDCRRSEDGLDRSNSECFVPVPDSQLEGSHSDHSSPRRRRSSSVSENMIENARHAHHGHHNGPHSNHHVVHHPSISHSQSMLQLNAAQTSGALAGGPSHHLVSPAINKYRQRRESSAYDLNSMKNSRSSEHVLRNMLTSSNSLHGITASDRTVSALPPTATSGRNDPSPPMGHRATGTAPARNASPSAMTSLTARGEKGSLPAPPARVRGSSFGADSSKLRLPAGGFGAAIASFLHNVTNPTSDKREDSRSGEVVQNMIASSFPPSTMGQLNSSVANRDHGFQHIVSLAEVDGMNGIAPLGECSPFANLDGIDDHLYSTDGFKRSPFGLLEDSNLEEVQVVHNLDVAENVPLQYSLPAVLSAFNSARGLVDVIELWPEAVRDFSVEIIVFLLRWHVIIPVEAYIVNMLHMFEQSAQAEACLAAETERRSPVPPSAALSTTTSAKASAPVPPISTTRVNFAPDTTPIHHGTGTSPTSYSSSFYRGSSESKTSLSQYDEAFLPLRAQLPKNLSVQELAVMERIFPFVAHTAVSSKSISEIVWIVRIPEEEIVHVVEKVSFLQIVKKVSP